MLLYLLGGGPAGPKDQRSQRWGCPLGRHFSLLDASWAHFALLAALFVVVAGFCASWSVPVSILERSGGLRGGFGRFPGPIIRRFFVLANLQCAKTPKSQKLQFFLSFSYVFRTLHACRIYKNWRKIDPGTFRKALLTKTVPQSHLGYARARF